MIILTDRHDFEILKNFPRRIKKKESFAGNEKFI